MPSDGSQSAAPPARNEQKQRPRRTAGRGTPGLPSSIALFVRRLRSIRRVHGWIVPELFRLARGRVLLYLGLAFLATATRAAAFTVVILYVKAHVDGTPIQFRGISLPGGTTLPVLLAWGSAALFFACLTALARYNSQVLAFDIGKRYVEHASARVIDIVARSASLRIPEDFDEHRSGVAFASRVLTSSMMAMLRMILAMLAAIGPLLMLLLAAATLLIINLPLTLAVATVTMAYVIPFYWFNREVVHASRDRETYGRRNSKMLMRLLGYLSLTRHPRERGAHTPDWAQHFLQSTTFQSSMSAFRTVILTRPKVASLKDAALGLALLMLLVIFGVFAGEDGSWALLLTYLLALSVAAVNLDAVAIAVTSVNRLLPQVTRYVAFRELNDLPPQTDAPHPSAAIGEGEGESANRLELHATEPLLPDSMPMIAPKPGHVLLVFYPAALDRYCFESFFEHLTQSSPTDGRTIARSAIFQGADAPPPFVPLDEVMRAAGRADDEISDGTYAGRLEATMEAAGVLSEFREQVARMADSQQVDEEPQISNMLSSTICLASAALSDSRLVVLNWSVVSGLDDRTRQDVLRIFSDRLVLFVSRRVPHGAPSGVSHFILADETGVHGIGDAEWFVAARSKIQEHVTNSSTRAEGDDPDIDMELENL